MTDRMELSTLLEAACEGTLNAEGLQRLEQLIAADDEALWHYVTYLHLHGTLQWMQGAGGGHRSDEPAGEAAPTPRFLARFRTYLSAHVPMFSLLAVLLLLAVWLVGSVGTWKGLVGRNSYFDRQSEIKRPQRAGVPPLGGISRLKPELQPPSPHPSPVARLLRADNCQWLDPGAAPPVGGALQSGQKIELRSGMVEIAFDRGARVSVEGPAIFQVNSDNAAYLRTGRLRAKVPGSALGFAIETNWARITDLGTEFGVVAGYDEDWGEVHVFSGTVAVDSPESSLPLEEGQGERAGVPPLGGISRLKPELQPPTPNPKPRTPIRLSGGEGVTVSPRGEVQPIKAQPERVASAPSDREAFPLWGTGVNLDRGAADPHWEIIAVSTDPKFKPRPAVVCEPWKGWPATGDSGQFLSDAKELRDQPGGCRWTFRTRFDLSGFDPATARIEGRFAVDNYLVGVRLNGKELPAPPKEAGNEQRFRPLIIDRGFVAGENTLELVVENGYGGPWNPMGLCVQWKGAAKPEKN